MIFYQCLVSFIRPIKVIVQHDPIYPAKFIILRSISLFGKGLEGQNHQVNSEFLFSLKINAVHKRNTILLEKSLAASCPTLN